jgi:hypothetical protein
MRLLGSGDGCSGARLSTTAGIVPSGPLTSPSIATAGLSRKTMSTPVRSSLAASTTEEAEAMSTTPGKYTGAKP